MNRRTFLSLPTLVLIGLGTVPHLHAQEKPAAPGEIVIRQAVAVSGVSRGGRVPFAEDAVLSQIVRGTWQPPKAGDSVSLPDGSMRAWETVSAGADGTFTGRALAGGYVYAAVASPEERICLLEAPGSTVAYVNGEPHAGDPYSYGYLRLPVRLKKGTNHLLFVAGRGRLKARLLPVAAPLVWNTDDSTLPDFRVGQTETLWAAVPLINTTDRTLKGLKVQASVTGGRTIETTLSPLPPMTVRKVGFRIEPPRDIVAGTVSVSLRIVGGEKGTPPAETTLTLRSRKPDETFKQTFLSDIDGTVQYFAVNPARKPSPANAFVLSLHGASVEAIGQADAYSGKDGITLVAPTNRRPYGFDWEDWGRLDALEVLSVAKKQFPHDPARTFLTGHSMGGHGTWSVGSLFPDRFAVIGPSAGWISFATYGGGRRPGAAETPLDAVTSLVRRAANQHDTFAWSENLLQQRIYIVHGDADDNVPVTEARRMRERLTEINHPRVEWHEEKGAGHWWDDDKTPGAECVDWRPLFALFETERLSPGSWNEVHFTTVNPAVSGVNRWLRIEQQEKSLLPSSVRLTWNRNDGTITGATQNVVALTVETTRLPGEKPLNRFVLDGQTVEVPVALARGAAALRRVAGKWQVAPKGIPAGEKNAGRGGPFKQAFNHRFVLVYGTAGTPEENAWSYARARYDAESFLYRGNGSPDVIADRDYDERTMRDRSVILYGNADTNRLWNRLLKDSPVQVRRGVVRVGARETAGANLACVFLRPKPGSDRASVGVIAATGAEGFRLTERLPYFTSGAAFPDWVIAEPTVLTDTRRGVVAAGYFGNDWGLTTGESAWR
jgi:poly(3-hydroxybutyrate) depolymerase